MLLGSAQRVKILLEMLSGTFISDFILQVNVVVLVAETRSPRLSAQAGRGFCMRAEEYLSSELGPSCGRRAGESLAQPWRLHPGHGTRRKAQRGVALH